MRFLILVIIVALCVYAIWFRSEPTESVSEPPMKIEDTFISGPMTPYNKAQKFQQQDYNQALDEHRKTMDEQEEN